MKFFVASTLFAATAVVGQYVPCRNPLFKSALCIAVSPRFYLQAGYQNVAVPEPRPTRQDGMRLINTKTLQLEEFFGNKIPSYAILSHTWGDDEVTYQEWVSGDPWRQEKKGFPKIVKACVQAFSGITFATGLFSGHVSKHLPTELAIPHGGTTYTNELIRIISAGMTAQRGWLAKLQILRTLSVFGDTTTLVFGVATGRGVVESERNIG